MKPWIDRWNAYWFPRTSTVPLAICRILMVAAQLYWLGPTMAEHYNLLSKNPTFIDPQWVIRGVAAVIPRHVLFTPSGFHALYWVAVVSGVLAIVGLFTRLSLFVFALATWIFVAHLYSYADIHHPEAVFSILLMLLPFAPSGDSLSIDAWLRRRTLGAADRTAPAGQSDMAMWPLKTAHALMALTYFSTGLTKMVFGGVAWMNGYTLQGYLLADGLRRNLPLGLWVAQHHTLCVLLSIGTVIFELFFFVSLIWPRTAPFFFVNALLFQTGLLLTAGHKFYPHMFVLVLLLLFIQPEWWREPLRKYLGLPLAWAGREPVRQAL